MKIFIVLFLVTAFPNSVMANESGGFVYKLLINQDGYVLFSLDKKVNHRPKCANNIDWQFKVDSNSNVGSKMYSFLQLAIEKNKEIIVGYGPDPSCGKGFPAVEVKYLYLNHIIKKDFTGIGNH